MSPFLLVVLLSAAPSDNAATPPPQPGLVRQEFVYTEAPFPSCHASTIVRTKSGLTAAWFGGTQEGHKDVGIWLSRHDGQSWSAPVEVANGVQSDGKQYPCWNPVLFQPIDGPLMLFYKVGPSPSAWWGMRITSDDDGRTWSKPERLPEGILGPVKNKPIQLSDGTILSGSSTEHDGWRWHVEVSTDGGDSWQRTPPLNDGKTFAAIQPTLLRHGDRIQALCRSRQGKIVTSWSAANSRNWTDPQMWSELEVTELPNPNSGIDAVTAKHGDRRRHYLVYNHTPKGRSPLNVAVSDDGRHWQAAFVLERQPGEYSYPAIIQTDDGLLHITYTWKRQRIKHVVLDPQKLQLRELRDGEWPN